MIESDGSRSAITTARVTGFLYLMIIVAGMFSEVFVRGNLIVPGDAPATAAHILSSGGLFRLGFLSDMIMLLCDVAVAVLFYVLLKPVNATLSLLAAAFRLTQAAVLGMNLLNYYAALFFIDPRGVAAPFEVDQAYALAAIFLDMHGHGYDIGLIFFGFSSLILGYLMIKSAFFPKILGFGLMAAALVYLSGSFTRFIMPAYLSHVEPFYIIPLLSELSLCLWLLLKGIKG